MHAPLPRHNPELHALLLEQLNALPRGHVLDLPSGPGYLLKDLKVLGFSGIAGEIDSALHVFSDISYVPADMSQRLPFEKGTFDYVVSIEGIEHIENHFNFIREVARVLKPGGRLFLTTPNVLTLESRLQFFLSGFHEAAPKPIPRDTPNLYFEHINLITLPQFYFFCEQAGLVVEKVTTLRTKKGSLLLSLFLFPLVWAATYIACFTKEKDPKATEENRRLFRTLTSPAVLLGSHLVVTCRKSGGS